VNGNTEVSWSAAFRILWGVVVLAATLFLPWAVLTIQSQVQQTNQLRRSLLDTQARVRVLTKKAGVTDEEIAAEKYKINTLQ
jgi:hypothetical protein